MRCYIGEHIKPEVRSNWNKTENYKTTRYSGYEDYGPGVVTSAIVPWSKQLTDAEAKKITIKNILNGWEPKDCNFKM